MQSDQLCSIGADMMSATSLSLSLYNLLLFVRGPEAEMFAVGCRGTSVPLQADPLTLDVK